MKHMIDYKTATVEELKIAIRKLEIAIAAYGPYALLPIPLQDHVDDLEELLQLYKDELKRRLESL